MMQFGRNVSQSNALLQQNESFWLRYGSNRTFFTVKYEVHNRDDQNQWHFLGFSDYQESDGRIKFKGFSFNFSVKRVKLSFETSPGKLNLTLGRIISSNWEMNRKQLLCLISGQSGTWRNLEKKASQPNSLLQQNENFGLRYWWNRTFFTVNYQVDNRDNQKQWHFLGFSEYEASHGGINLKSVSFNFSAKNVKLPFVTSIGK